jgi:hypothetical protein
MGDEFWKAIEGAMNETDSVDDPDATKRSKKSHAPKSKPNQSKIDKSKKSRKTGKRKSSRNESL